MYKGISMILEEEVGERIGDVRRGRKGPQAEGELLPHFGVGTVYKLACRRNDLWCGMAFRQT